MPFLSRRRSALDLLKPAQEDNESSLTVPTDTLSPNRRPDTARPVSDHGHSRSRLSHEVQPEDVDDTADNAGERAKRFSMLKLRNLSESALTARAKEAEKKSRETQHQNIPTLPSGPSVPAILKTAPTMEDRQETMGEQEETMETEDEGLQMKSRPFFKRSMSKGRNAEVKAIRKFRKSIDEKRAEKSKPRKSTDESRSERKGPSLRWRKLQGKSTALEDLAKLASTHVSPQQAPPPSYGDDSTSALALPVFPPRMSESGASEDSNASSDQIYGSTTTTTHTVSTHTTFFKLARRNKNRNSLFPLPVKIPPPEHDHSLSDGLLTPRAQPIADTPTEEHVSTGKPAPPAELHRRHTESPTRQPRSINHAPLPKHSLAFAEPSPLIRNNSELSRGSSTSSPLRPPRLGMRDRASTASSLGRDSYEPGTPPTFTGSGRNSTSTQGRPSFGALLGISRFRQSSDPNSPRHGSPGANSKANSFALSREALVVPEREEGDTPGKYLERLEAAVSRSMIAGILSKSGDPFAQAVLRSYTRRFAFFGEPIDMSLRKFLLEAELPKETQQVDRVIQAFADRYHECNPGIFMAPDQAYIIAFSLMMLHTDAFNKNNKRKMQKHDYIKNTSGQSVSDDILGCFYDNICYTPFVHYDEEVDINGERVLPFKPKAKKSKLKGAITDSATKKPSGPVDPYNLLVDQNLDMLRPAIKESITLDDPYNYRTAQTNLDPHYLQRAFTHTGVLQIISQRSRPSAFEGQLLNGEHPATMETHMKPGIIDIKITKVGTLWRKATRKKKARSPWQEWGAVLTGSQLYLFKNAHWAKGLVHQFMAAQKHGHPRIPVIFKPPLPEFKPDALIKTDDSVALIDATYTRHKNAFTVVRPGGLEEVLLADNESELNDWLALINYAAAFRAAGVRIRGMVGGAEEDPRTRELRRLESTHSTQSAESALSVQRGTLSPQLQRQVMAARRQIMVQKIGETALEISDATKELDDMLRNARHLLVLAPIAPRTREDIIHAAAQADASIKWTRRDIWRLKCHKDLLALDVQQDGLSAADLEVLADQQLSATESAKKSRPSMLKRFTTKAVGAKSPPQSPTSNGPNDRPMTTGSAALDSIMNHDVFRSPPEAAAQETQTGDWRLPPLQLDVLREEQQHRSSISSTLLSTSSQGRLSVSNASTMSSIRQVTSTSVASDDVAVEDTPRGRQSSVDDGKTMPRPARTDTSFERKGTTNADGAAPLSTPDSNKQKSGGGGGGMKRGLQKTLRDSQSTAHRHRRGKESDSTIKSGHAGDATTGEEPQESTPGLKREKGRFILHGKQASVVQFGNEWHDDKMKLRQDMWRQNTASSSSGGGGQHESYWSMSTAQKRQSGGGLSGWRIPTTATAGSVVLDLTDDGDGDGDANDSGDEGYSTPPDTADGLPPSPTLLKAGDDALITKTGMTASPEMVSEHDTFLDPPSGDDADAEATPLGNKRETIVGLGSSSSDGQRVMSVRKVEDSDAVVTDNEDEDQGLGVHLDDKEAKGRRVTVIGPRSTTAVNGEGGDVKAGAQAEGDDA